MLSENTLVNMDKIPPGFSILKFDGADEIIKKLVKLASDARQKSYAPYSNFKVGAALLSKDGEIFLGCNVENSSYGLTVCAEQTAVVKAISTGKRDILAIAVVADSETFTTPCGKCRQFLNEFGQNIDVYCAKTSFDEILLAPLSNLLPMSFPLLKR